MRQPLFFKYHGFITGNGKLQLFFLCLCSFLSVISDIVYAQTVNKRYFYPSTQVNMGDIAPNEPNNHIFFTSNTYDQNGNVLYLTRTNLNGDLPLTVRMPGGGIHKIIETIDNGVIVMFIDQQWALLVIKYDVNLVQQWVRRMPLLPAIGANPTLSLDIKRVYYPNLNEEHYFVVAPTGTTAAGYAATESVYMAARLTQAGAVVWRKTYVDVNKPTSPYLVVNETIGCIEPMPNGNQWNFLIGSNRYHFNWFVGDQYRMSYLMIDENGAVISPYRAYRGNSTNPHRSRIKWDGQNFACLFTDYQQPNPTGAVSGACLMQLTPALNFVQGKIYATLFENYGFSIQQSTDGNYIMGTGVSGMGAAYPQHIKLDINTLNVIWANNYNVNVGQWFPSQHRTTTTDHNYCTVNRGPNIMRLLKTDNLGLACGSVEAQVWHVDFTPTYDDYTYVDVDNPANMLISYPYSPVSIPYDSCISSAIMDPGYYRIAGTGNDNVEEELQQGLLPSRLTVSVFPTYLTNESSSVSCVVNSPEDKNINILVSNILGQIVYQETKVVTVGSNTFAIPAERLSNGMNMIKVIVDGKMLETTKVIVAK